MTSQATNVLPQIDMTAAADLTNLLGEVPRNADGPQQQAVIQSLVENLVAMGGQPGTSSATAELGKLIMQNVTLWEASPTQANFQNIINLVRQMEARAQTGDPQNQIPLFQNMTRPQTPQEYTTPSLPWQP